MKKVLRDLLVGNGFRSDKVDLLKPHQINALRDIVKKYKKEITRLFLAYDMGLGKTLISIAMQCILKQDRAAKSRPGIVLCPPALLWAVWDTHYGEWTRLKAAVITDSKTAKDAACPFPDADVFILSYNVAVMFFKTVYEKVEEPYETAFGTKTRMVWARKPGLSSWLLDTDFGMVILDEGHKACNINSLTNRVCRDITAGATLVIMSTGTPITNRPSDIGALKIAMSDEQTVFKEWKEMDKGSVDRQLVEEFQSNHELRMTKAQLHPPLPPHSEKQAPYHLNESDERKSYNVWLKKTKIAAKEVIRHQNTELMKEAISKLLICIQKTGMSCFHPGLPDIDKEDDNEIARLALSPSSAMVYAKHKIEQLLSEHNKIIVCSHMTSELKAMKSYADGWYHQESVTYDGSLNSEERKEALRRIESDEKCRLVFLSLKSGGCGLTLTACTAILFIDQWWSKAAMNQARDRIDRIGQTLPTESYNMYSPKAISHKITDIQADKIMITNVILDGVEGFFEKGARWKKAVKLIDSLQYLPIDDTDYQVFLSIPEISIEPVARKMKKREGTVVDLVNPTGRAPNATPPERRSKIKVPRPGGRSRILNKINLLKKRNSTTR